VATRTGTEVAATAETPGLRSTLRNLRGFTIADVTVEAGISPLGEWAAVPSVATDGAPASGTVLAAVVVLDRGGPGDPDPALTIAADGQGGHHVTLTWPDGVTAEVALPAPD